MKKELVILAGNCFPVCSATGSIAIDFAKYLMLEYHINMIVIEQEGFHYDNTKIKEIDVYSIINWRLRWAQKSKKKRDTTKGWISKIYNVLYQLARVIGRIQATFFTINNNAWYTSKAYKQLKKINQEKNISAILTCAAPHEAHYAGYKFKMEYPKIKWVSYWGDLLASRTNNVNLFISMRRLGLIERSICNASDYIMTTEENYSVLQNRVSNKVKIKALPYTLNQSVLDSYNEKSVDSCDNATIIYMGAFYKEIRNPEYFLNLFSNIDSDYRLLLFSSGNCESIVERYVRKSKGKIKSLGQIPKEKLIEELKKATFLINIENKMKHSNPSKLLELISYGKPIIDFSFSEEPCETLIRYPYYLNVNMNNDIASNMKRVENFIKTNRTSRIELGTIQSLYENNLESNIKNIVLTIFGGGDR